MLAPLLDDEDELYKYTAIAVYKVFHSINRFRYFIVLPYQQLTVITQPKLALELTADYVRA